MCRASRSKTRTSDEREPSEPEETPTDRRGGNVVDAPIRALKRAYSLIA